MTVRMRKRAAAALYELEKSPRVVGIARDRHDRLILLLDRDDDATRSAAARWAKTYATEIGIKIVGKVVAG